jgi:hypothetical protein
MLARSLKMRSTITQVKLLDYSLFFEDDERTKYAGSIGVDAVLLQRLGQLFKTPGMLSSRGNRSANSIPYRHGAWHTENIDNASNLCKSRALRGRAMFL